MYPDRFPKIAIHARSFACGFDRHSYLQSTDRWVYDEARPDFFKPNSRRRNQSRAGQSTERVAGSDAGTAGHNWRTNLSALRSVSCAGNSKPDRTRRDLPAARSAARSVHVQIEYRLSPKIWGAKHSGLNGDLGAGFASGSGDWPKTNHRRTRRGQQHLYRWSGKGLHCGRCLGDARACVI